MAFGFADTMKTSGKVVNIFLQGRPLPNQSDAALNRQPNTE
jgi:hypothetical protein